MPVNLPDGVYPIDGDGEAGSPEMRWSPVLPDQRRAYFCWVKNGEVVGTTGRKVGTPRPKDFADYHASHMGNLEAKYGKVETLLKKAHADYLKVDVPDGFYKLPGDGKVGDPDRWETVYNEKEYGTRFWYYVQVKDSAIRGLNGWDEASDHIASDLGYVNQAKVFMFEKRRGARIHDLLKKATPGKVEDGKFIPTRLPDGVYKLPGEYRAAWAPKDDKASSEIYPHYARIKDGKIWGFFGVTKGVAPTELDFRGNDTRYLLDFQAQSGIDVLKVLTETYATKQEQTLRTLKTQVALDDGIYKIPGSGVGSGAETGQWKSPDGGSISNHWIRVQGRKITGFCGMSHAPKMDTAFAGDLDYMRRFEEKYGVEVADLICTPKLDLPDGVYHLPGDGKEGDTDRWPNGCYADNDIGSSRYYYAARVENGEVVSLGGSGIYNYVKETTQTKEHLYDFEKNRGVKVQALLHMAIKSGKLVKPTVAAPAPTPTPVIAESPIKIPDGWYLLKGDGKGEGEEKNKWWDGNREENAPSSSKHLHHVHIKDGQIDGITTAYSSTKEHLFAYPHAMWYAELFEKNRGVKLMDLLVKTLREKVADGIYLVPGDGVGEGEERDRRKGLNASRVFWYAEIKDGAVKKLSGLEGKRAFKDLDNLLDCVENGFLQKLETITGINVLDLIAFNQAKPIQLDAKPAETKPAEAPKLADGIYKLPGDGKAEDPDRRGYCKGDPTRYHWYAKVQDGKVAGLNGYIAAQPIDQIVRATGFSPHVLQLFESEQNLKVEDLLMGRVAAKIAEEKVETPKAANLADGWYIIPGDEKGDGKRFGVSSPDMRYFWIAQIKDGKVVHVSDAQPNKIIKDIKHTYSSNVARFEQKYGSVVDILTKAGTKPSLTLDGQIPDGVYEVPGDGLAGDPDRRIYQKGGTTRYHWYVKVHNGAAIEAAGLAHRHDDVSSVYGFDSSVLRIFEASHGIKMIDLVLNQKIDAQFVKSAPAPAKPTLVLTPVEVPTLTPTKVEPTKFGTPTLTPTPAPKPAATPKKEEKMPIKVRIPDGIYLLQNKNTPSVAKPNQWQHANYSSNDYFYYHYFQVEGGFIKNMNVFPNEVVEIDPDIQMAANTRYIADFEKKYGSIAKLLEEQYGQASHTSGLGKVALGVIAGLISGAAIKSALSPAEKTEDKKVQQEKHEPFKCEV